MSDDSSNRTDVSTIHLDNISLQNRENVDSNITFIGFDLSTQQLKAIVINDKLEVCHQVSVDFDAELSEYKTRGGVHKADDGSNTVTAPVNMWLKALDLCLDKLKIDGLDFSSVLGVSGCAQQHGSVWWRRDSANLLANLNPDEYLHKELVSAFALRDTPVWMDSSTSVECRQLEAHVGGPAKLAELTGSRAYERFTGPQIARIFKHRREAYAATERITLVSNFLASVLMGAYAPLDACDASGMNMMDVRRKRWSAECLAGVLVGGLRPTEGHGGVGVAAAAAGSASEPHDALEARLATELAGLRARLGCSDGTPHTLNNNIVDTHEVAGRVARYFVERYGFPPECLVSSFTGDNPASMAGLCVKQDELILSLGTSDTAFFWLDEPRPGVNGHVLRNPLDDSKYMGLICFKNGSKTRERIRDTCCGGSGSGVAAAAAAAAPQVESQQTKADKNADKSAPLAGWPEFERLLNATPPGNLGHLAFYFDLREIYPLAKGDFRYDERDQRVSSFAAPELEVRACVEGQFLRLYHHAQALGLQMSRIKRVLVTGGASANRAILQVIADIFGTPVYTLGSLANSACLGAAYLAKYAHELEQQKLDQSFSQTGGAGERLVVESELGAGAPPPPPPPPELDELPETKRLLERVSGDSLEALRGERQIDFSQMILGGGGGGGGSGGGSGGAALTTCEPEHEERREISLVRAAEPRARSEGEPNVYAALLERYVRLETEIALNNEA